MARAGQSLSDAAALARSQRGKAWLWAVLGAAGLALGVVANQYSNTVPLGDVISQDPAACITACARSVNVKCSSA